MHPNVHSCIVHNSQIMEGAETSTDDWIKKLWSIYTMEYYSAFSKNKFSTFAATRTALEEIMLSEI